MIKLYDLYIFIYVSLELVLSKVVGSSNIDFTISNICLLFSKKKENSPNCILLYFWYEVHCDEFLWLTIFSGRTMPVLTRSPTTCSRKCISRLGLWRVEETGDWNCIRCGEDKRAGRDTIGEKDEKLKKEHNKGKVLENLKKRSKEQESNGQHWEKGEKLAK